MIAIVEYKAGNTKSVQNALSRLGYESVVTNEHNQLIEAKKVILPGVGEAKSAMENLRETGLDQLLPNLSQPVLGICLGLQLMCKHTEEGNINGLGIFDTSVKNFPANGKVPHMGWNNFNFSSGRLLQNIDLNSDVYYVHSFYAEICASTVASCNYISRFSAVLEKENFYATQFHPEKSAGTGEKILQNFLEI